MLTYGKVAAVAVVGNEDGAHRVVADCLQALSDTGFSIAANAGTYWVGEAMQGTDYNDLEQTPRPRAPRTRCLRPTRCTWLACSGQTLTRRADRRPQLRVTDAIAGLASRM